MKSHYSKKIIALVIIFGFVFSSIPKTSSAVWGAGDIVSDFGVIPEEVTQTIGQVTEIVNMVQATLKEFGLDVVIYKLASQASQKLIAKVLNHTNGGENIGDGVEELFVKNFTQHFQNIDDQEFGKFTEQLGSDTSNPFSKLIATSLVKDRADPKSLLSGFSLDKIEGVDWQAASTDLSSAGENGLEFFNQLAKPENTPLGSSLIAQSELSAKIAKKVDVAKTELTSSGFKPDKGKCTSSPDIGSGYTYKDNGNGSSVIDTSVPKKEACTDASAKSPSSTNEEQSKQATNEAFERLRNSDELGKILMNTITQLAQGLIKKGLSSLSSDGGASSKVYGGPQDLSKALNQPGASWLSAPQQVVDLKADLEPSMQKLSLEIGYVGQMIELVKAPIVGKVPVNGVPEPSIVLALEACIPGPDTNYEQRAQEYGSAQLEDTQMRAGADTDKGTKNTNALQLITRLSSQAIQEEKIALSNPFLNIPAANEMKGALREFYKLTTSFTGMVDTIIIKRQTLNSLQSIQAQVRSYGPGLVLFNSDWNALTAAGKQQLYTTLTPKIHAAFPEYINPAQPDNVNTLSPIVDNPLTIGTDEGSPENKDLEMKKRIFDEQWDEWETTAPEIKKNEIYRQFVGLGRDISDSATVENSRLKVISAEYQIKEIALILNDCRKIREYAVSSGVAPVSTTLLDSLTSQRIKDVVAVNGPSIFNALQILGPTEFTSLNDRIIPSTEDLAGLTGANFTGGGGLYGQVWQNLDSANTLQQNLPTTPADLIQQDLDERAFCRLTMYHIIYWAPDQLTGKPIGCAHHVMIPHGIYGSTNMVNADRVTNIGSTGLPLTAVKLFDAHWYHTNAAELLYKLNE